MNAPWVDDMRYFAQLDAKEAAESARDQIAAEIAADPQRLATAMISRSDTNPLAIGLARALCAVYAAGEQVTSAQSKALCLAVQALADDAASYELEC